MKQFIGMASLFAAFSIVASGEEFRPIFHPPTCGIVEALQRDPDNFSTLIGLLKKADLKELRDAKASYTLLAPTNGAFAKLGPVYVAKLTKDPEALGRFLRAHLLPGKVLFSEVFAPASGKASPGTIKLDPLNQGQASGNAVTKPKPVNGLKYEDAPRVDRQEHVTKPMRTVDGGLALIACNLHPANAEKEHHPIINNIGRVVKSDIVGTYAVIQVIDAVLPSPGN